jgi:antitoxin ParD1/3/4
VASGLYTSASEVVREALRLLEEQDRLRDAKLVQIAYRCRSGVGWRAERAAGVKRKARARRTAGQRRRKCRRSCDRRLLRPTSWKSGGYVAEDSVVGADCLIVRVDEPFRLFATQSMIGSMRDEPRRTRVSASRISSGL